MIGNGHPSSRIERAFYGAIVTKPKAVLKYEFRLAVERARTAESKTTSCASNAEIRRVNRLWSAARKAADIYQEAN